jgi:hypothetical protein
MLFSVMMMLKKGIIICGTYTALLPMRSPWQNSTDGNVVFSHVRGAKKSNK